MARAAKGEGSIFKTDAGYRGYITINGRRKYASGTKKTEVAQKLREFKNQRDNGVLVVGSSPTLDAWIQHWLKATKESHAIKTHSGYESIIKDYLPAWLGDIRINKLTAEHLEEAYDALRQRKAKGKETPLSGATLYQLHSIIRASLTLATKRGHVAVNVAKNVVSPPKAESKKVRPFSNADVDRIYAALEESRSKARWTLGLELGPRPGEALAIEWPHVDFAEGSIKIEQQIQFIKGDGLRLVKYTKSDAGNRKLPLPGFVADTLLAHRDSQLSEMARSKKWSEWRDREESDDVVHAFVFTSARRPGWPITPSGDAQQWERLLEVAGVRKANPYTARHTAISRMIAAGIDLTVIAEIVGHANIKVLVEVYAHAIEERKVAAAGLLDAQWAMRRGAPYSAPYRPSPGQSQATHRN
ncbi:hypothetical protein ABE10_25385 [Bacillus toyonensis]|nr:hypothetical protein [Bacillus toyonensis]MBG9889830.1 hypothetical protein [Bacillus toyonensis]